ncbi:unnamed protein product [Orchesella dallaii]|uniref:C2H2-type domain-containing protein n=1 Tax=Orchesella dallaii TaxID=48710 RepID=A0ABP1R4J0_9HEXA
MSDDNESPVGSEVEEQEAETMFHCRSCKDGQTYTAAEKESHKLWHRAEKEKRTGKRKTRGRESQDGSVAFQEVSSSPAKKSGGEATKKRRSRKTFNTSVTRRKYKGA